MTGEEYDALWEKKPNDEDLHNTMFFLTSPPPSEKDKEEEYAPRDDWS